MFVPPRLNGTGSGTQAEELNLAIHDEDNLLEWLM
jgi:hypothetical protein